MALTIPLILDFLAKMLNLGGIAERITKIIQRIRKPIDQMIDKVIAWFTNKVKKLFGKGKKEKGKAQQVGARYYSGWIFICNEFKNSDL